jgi:hypothetical protein
LLRRPIPRTILLAGTCLLAVAPFLRWGIPSGHDFEFHVFSWMEVLGQWKHGIIFPRWAALAHFGYGEARFLFYPPASWTLGAALGALLPWAIVPAAYCWIALTFAAASMYRLARQWLAPADAFFAAVLYALNPYHLLIIYWRSAYAELLAAALLPLLLLCLLRIFAEQTVVTPAAKSDSSLHPTLWLTLVLAAAWLTNAPAAVMIEYSTAGFALLFSIIFLTQQTSSRDQSLRQRISSPQLWRPLLHTALAVFLAAGLASFYLFPAIYEQRWVNIAQVMSPGVRPQDNFIFTTTFDHDHNVFNRLVSSLASAEIIVLGFAIWFSQKQKTLRAKNTAHQIPWLPIAAWGAASAVLMFSATNFLWQHLPKFRFVQLPFRWLLCMNAALALLITMAARRWTSRALTYVLLLAALAYAGYCIQLPWWDEADDLHDMQSALASGAGYEGTDEYVPVGADAYELDKNLPVISDDSGLPVPNKILSWSSTEREVTVHADAAEDITVRLFNYPAWEVSVNGEPVSTDRTDITGLMIISLAAGDNDIRIHFRQTRDRLLGDIVSFISLIVLLAAWIMARRCRKQSTNTSRTAA